ncbi:MAG: acyltransferase family protein [Chitinivibrionales bacterium]|nr:acyltransferase family protein [Chitinivibrionales bacterium]
MIADVRTQPRKPATAATHAVSPKHYFTAIDGLRLIAAVNIVLFHAQQSGAFHEMHGKPWWFFAIVKGPAFHASLFFVLGGFIYTIKHAAAADRFSTRAFLRKRLAALYPLHVITTLAMVPFAVWGASEMGAWRLTGKMALSVGMHLSFLWSFFPFGTFALNRPSWALGAFFLCYLFFGPILRRVVRIENRRSVLAACVGCCAVPLAWAAVYGLVLARFGYDSERYFFFHVFPPVRMAEFVLGMLLARLYQVSTFKTGGTSIWNRPIGNDLLIAATFALIFGNLLLQARGGLFVKYLGYHALALPLFALLVYRFGRGTGLFPRFTSIPLVRRLGQASFYPYLLHIPCMGWLTWALAHFAGYRAFLHYGVNVFLFVALLYVGSMVYMEMLSRKRRRARQQAAGEA